MVNRRSAGFLMAGVILVAFAPSMQAQTASELTPEEIRWLLIEEQLVQSLGSPNEAVVERTLHNALLFSVMNRDKIDIHRIGDEVIRTHKRSKSPEVRQAALAVLQVVGTNRAVGYAQRFSVDEREISHILAMEIFENYFGNRFLMAAQGAPR